MAERLALVTRSPGDNHMLLNYFVGGTIVQLPHILPIAIKLGGTIYTDDAVTKKWLSLHHPEISCVEIKKINEIPPCNIIVADYFRFPESFNRIQIFHGFSLKDYIDKCPWESYDVIVNPSPYYSLPIQHVAGFSRKHLYASPLARDPNKQLSTCLYCPTWRLGNSSKFESLQRKYPHVIVKFHPLDFNPHARLGGSKPPPNPVIDKIVNLGGIIVDPMSREYIEYELLFEKVDAMSSDRSSIAYEFTLTGKPVLEHNDMNKQWYHDTDFFKEIEKFLK